MILDFEIKQIENKEPSKFEFNKFGEVMSSRSFPTRTQRKSRLPIPKKSLP
jgi:hypothetical protein